MPSTWRNNRAVQALRAGAARAHRRAESLPRMPFAIALAVAAVLLAAVIESDPNPDRRITEVAELPSPSEIYDFSFDLESAEPEILEYGFSEIAVEGREWILVGAVVRNPYEQSLESGAFAVTTAADGASMQMGTFYGGGIPAGSTVLVGHVMDGGSIPVPLEELRIEPVGTGYLWPEDLAEEEAGFEAAPRLPEVALAGVEPLASPDGLRFTLRVVKAEGYLVERWSVLFRDGEGNLIGGLPGVADPFAVNDQGGVVWLPEGESLQHVDVLEAWMPEAADRDRIEIGPTGTTMG